MSFSISAWLIAGITGTHAQSLLLLWQYFTLLLNVFSYGQDLCKELHQKIDAVDEERYDLSLKVAKSEKEVLNAWILFILHGLDFQQITLCVFLD